MRTIASRGWSLLAPAPPRRDAKFTDIVGGGHTIWDPIYDLSSGSDNAKP